MRFPRWLVNWLSPAKPIATAVATPVQQPSKALVELPPEPAAPQVAASAAEQPACEPDAPWLEHTLMHYKDPLEYRHGTLSDLTDAADDVVWIDRPAESYSEPGATPPFYDAERRPVGDFSSFLLPPTRSAVFTMGRSDVVLAGYRAFIGRDGTYNLDESFTPKDVEDIETARLGHPEVYRNEMIGFRDTEQRSVFLFERGGRKSIRIDEPVICLSSNEAPNYGSFLFRIYPKLMHTSRLSATLPILAPNYFSAMRPFLELAGIEPGRIINQYIDHLYYIRRAIVPSMPNRHIWLDDDTLAFYDGLVARHGQARTTRRIYVTRRAWNPMGGSGSRVMTNETELIEELERRDFEIVEPEKLSAVEQIRLFSSAAVIVIAGGSAIYNTVFCRPGTKLIDIEGEPHWLGGHAKLFHSRGLDYGIFEGQPSTYDFSAHHQPFTVDIARFRHRLDAFLK